MANEIQAAFNAVFPDGPISQPSQPEKRRIRIEVGGTIQAEVDSIRDIAFSGASWKQPVIAASTGNINLSNSLVSGLVMDGRTLATGDRVLLKNQTSVAQNGIYVVVASGAASRASDADDAEKLLRMATFVRFGTANGGKQYINIATAPITVGTTELHMREISDQSSINANLSALEDYTNQVLDVSNGVPLLDGEFSYAYVTPAGKVMIGFRHDASVYVADAIPMLDPEFAYVETYGDGVTILFGVRHDGTSFPGQASSSSDGTKAWVSDNEVFVFRDNRRVPITYATPAGQENFGAVIDGDFVRWSKDTGTTVEDRSDRLLAETALSNTVTKLVMYLIGGQSLSIGVQATPAIHTSAVRAGRAAMFIGGIRPGGALPENIQTPAANLYSLLDAAAEPSDGESPGAALVYGATGAGGLASTEAALVINNGVSGYNYTQLKKGTVSYANRVEDVRRARVIAGLNGMSSEVAALHWIHGTADRDVPLATYLGYLTELQSDLSVDIGESVRIVCSQMSNWTKDGGATSDVPLAQLKAAIDTPNLFLCVGPEYMLATNSGGIHLTAAASARLGSYHARTINRKRAGLDALPLYCTGATRTGAVIRLAMHVPVGPLVIDTTAVTNPGNFGITWAQTGGTARTISSVAVSGAEIVVTLSGDPGAFTSASIGIARTGTVGANAGPTTGARSCFRDSATDLDIDGVAMPNWACHQNISIS